MTYNNYAISFSKGQLYLKSKEPKEGFEKVNYGLTNEKTTYHRYEKSTKGLLKALEVKEIQFEGKTLQFLELSFEDGDVLNKISTGLKNSKGNYTDEVKAIVSALNGANANEVYTFTPVKKTTVSDKTKKEYTNINVYLNYVNRLNEQGKGLSTGFIPFSDIPAAVREEDPDLGVTWDWKPVNRFYAVKIRELSQKFSGGTSSTEPTQAPAPAAPAPAAPAPAAPAPAVPVTNHMVPDEDDELPF